jgi:hypothetical protein
LDGTCVINVSGRAQPGLSSTADVGSWRSGMGWSDSRRGIIFGSRGEMGLPALAKDPAMRCKRQIGTRQIVLDSEGRRKRDITSCMSIVASFISIVSLHAHATHAFHLVCPCQSHGCQYFCTTCRPAQGSSSGLEHCSHCVRAPPHPCLRRRPLNCSHRWCISLRRAA